MSEAHAKVDASPEPEPNDADPAETADETTEPRVSRGGALFRMAAMTLVLLVIVEIGARTAFYVHRQRVDAAVAADYAPHTYIGDFAAKVNYRFINFYTVDPGRANNEGYDFDSFGFRLDSRKLRFDAPSKFRKIWLFGASTVQGLGAASDETIAAHLNERLEKNGSAYRVINMGQGGFTSTQELLLLVELLQAGHKPDLVLSYDGATEVPFRGDADISGVPSWEKAGPKARLLRDVQGDASAGTLIGLALSRSTRIDDIMLAIRRRLHPAPNDAFDADNWDVVMRRHLLTLNLMKAAAEQNGAPSFFFFQPVLGYETHYALRKLSTADENLRGRILEGEHERHDAFTSTELASLRAALGDRLVDMYDAFRGHDGETLYADARHPNGAGNAILAARIYERIADVVRTTPD